MLKVVLVHDRLQYARRTNPNTLWANANTTDLALLDGQFSHPPEGGCGAQVFSINTQTRLCQWDPHKQGPIRIEIHTQHPAGMSHKGIIGHGWISQHVPTRRCTGRLQ